MSLEACYIIIDSSEFMRNGDFPPNRFDAQIETINLLANAKTSGHPESTIGLMTMSGKRPEVLVTLGNDPTAIQTCIANMDIKGKSDLVSAISVAQLALKHRKNKNGGQRIVLFVGSPIEGHDAESFEKLGQRLKKNNISMDIVGFLGLGDDEKSNKEKLTALHKGVNKQDTSNLILLEPSSQIVADILLSGPLFGNTSGGSGEGSGEGGSGMNEMLDEYQMAIKLSLQEAEEEEKKRINSTISSTLPKQEEKKNQMEDEEELDEETRKAIELSMKMGQEDNMEDEEEENARKLSLELNQEVDNEKKEISEALKDVSVDDLFGNLPGVTTDSEQIQNALKNIKGEEKKDGNNNNNQDKKDN